MEKKEVLYYVLLTQRVHAHRISITAVSACEKFAEVWEKVSRGMMRTGMQIFILLSIMGFHLKITKQLVVCYFLYFAYWHRSLSSHGPIL